MVRRLEKLAEASKNVLGKAVLGTSLSLASIISMPSNSNAQNVNNEDKWINVTNDFTSEYYKDDGDYVFVFGNKTRRVDGSRVVERDGDVYVRKKSAFPRSNRGSSRNRSRSRRSSRSPENSTWLEKNDELVSSVAAGFIVGSLDALFSSEKSEKNHDQHSTSINVESIRDSYDRYPDTGDYSGRHEDGPGKWSSRPDSSDKDKSGNKDYASWRSHEGDTNEGNVRDAQAERSNGSNDKYASWKNKHDKDYRPSREKQRVSEVSPSLMAGNSNLRKFGEAPLAGDLYDAKQNVEDMQGKNNAVDNWYDKNLRRANEYFGCGDPARKESSFLCWETMPNSNSDYNDLAKIVTYKLIPK